MLRLTVLMLLFSGGLAADVRSPQVFLQSEGHTALISSVDAGAAPPIPTTSKCIVIIVCQFMLIYTALALCRTYQEFTGTAKGPVEDALRAAAQTTMYGPMLCVLFIACRMRVEFLSGGLDQPQIWVQNCMYGVTYAVLGSCLLVLLIPLLTGKPMPLKEGDYGYVEKENDHEHEHDQSQVLLISLTVARFAIFLGLYVGLAGIIVGINIYLPPGATDLAKLPPPAPAVWCTMVLSVVFFLTQLVIAICRSYGQFKGVEFPRMISVMQEAATTVEFAPMLAIVFLTARMRALQHDSQPQRWAQDCMYAATAAMCVTCLFAILIPFSVGGEMVTDPKTNEKTFVVPNGSKTLTHLLIAIRYLCMVGFYGGVAGVLYSIFTFEAPGGPSATLPVSPAAHCVVNLSFQFFFVYGMMTVMLTVSSVTGISMEKSRFFSALEAAKSTLGFAPMLCMLFVTTRMYALLLTKKKGAPQAWVQDGMYMATWALLISFVACLVTGLAMDEVHTDEDGNVVTKFANPTLGIAMSVLRYVTMLLLYGGILMVVVGLFTMTPENANGRGSVPVVSDVVNATPMGSKPPSVADASAPDNKQIPSLDSKGAQGR